MNIAEYYVKMYDWHGDLYKIKLVSVIQYNYEHVPSTLSMSLRSPESLSFSRIAYVEYF